jgi:uncharacterized protein YuzE
MKKRKFIFLGAILAVVLLVGATSCTAADLKSLEGILQNVDSASGNVTVTLKDGTTATFNLSDINVDTIRQALGDASLDTGDNVTLEKGRNGEVKGLEVLNAEVQGIIQSLGTDNITITTNVTGNKNNGDITLQVTRDTVIRGGGKDKPVFTDLKLGQRIVVKYDVSTLKALTITLDANGQIQDNHNNNGQNQGNQNNNGKGQGNQNIQGKMGHN